MVGWLGVSVGVSGVGRRGCLGGWGGCGLDFLPF